MSRARTPQDETGADHPPPPGPGRRRALAWSVIGIWTLLLLVIGPYAGKLSGAQDNDPLSYLPASTDSTQAAELLRELPGGDTLDLIVVYERAEGLTDGDLRAATEQARAIESRYETAGDAPAEPVPSEDGSTAFFALALTGLGDDDDAEADAVEDIRDQLASGVPDGLAVSLGGPGAIGVDTSAVFQDIDVTLTLATVLVVTVLLIAIYRSPLLWLLPLICVGIAAAAAMTVVYALTQAFGLTVSSQNSSIMTVLLFGVGTDYALLLVARYRDELREHRDAYEAMRVALRGCVPALLASSGTVAAALLCLMVADLNTSSGLGPVGSVAVLCALAVMTTLLPALLVLCGRRIFWPLIPAYGSEPRAGVFARLGSSVSRRPVALLAGGTVLLGVLSLGVLNLPGPLKDQDYFIDTPESVTAMQTLAEAYPEQSAQPISLLADSAHADRALAVAEETDGVASAVPGRSVEGWTEINVFSVSAAESDGERQTVRDLREALADLPGQGALVGGDTATTMDVDDTNASDRVLVIPLVLLFVLVILWALFRSLVAAALLLGAVVVSWGAALGLAGLFFGPVFGFAGTDGWLLLCTFVFSVSLGVDYGIFLMHRMREETLRGLDTRQSVLVALHKTGGVIASAGIVLAATFAVLMSLPLVFMVEIGFVVAVGVLLDTFLVRPYLLTSACWLLDRRLWWPRTMPASGNGGGGGPAGSGASPGGAPAPGGSSPVPAGARSGGSSS